MNILTDTLWNNFNKRHQWIFDAADKIREEDRAMRLRRRSGAVPAEPCCTVSGLRPPAAIASGEIA